MPRLRNISGLGALEIDGVGVVESGAEFDVTDDQASGLVGQVENFELVADVAPVPPAPVVDTSVVADPAPDPEPAAPAVDITTEA